MKRVLGVAAFCALLVVAGCGGVAELDSGEVDTVNQAKAIVAEGKANGKLAPGDGAVLTEFMILCRAKPLSEVDGDTLRETMDELAPQLKGVDQKDFDKMDHNAETGCD